MEKGLLLSKIKSGDYDKDRLYKWVKAMPGSSGAKPPTVSKKGDVYMHPIFKHPYVLLYKTKGYWVCTLMTSNGDFKEVLEPCESRFFDGSYITQVLFTLTEPIGSWCNVYDNDRQLRSVARKLRKVFKR